MRQIIYALTGSEANPPVLDRLIPRFADRVRDDLEDIIWNAKFAAIPGADGLFATFSALPPVGRVSACLNPIVFAAICDARVGLSVTHLSRLASILSQDPAEAGSSEEGFLLGDTIWADTGSEDCRRVDPTSPVFEQAFVPLTTSEHGVVSAKLVAALEEIDRTAPSFGRLIRNYTRRIYVRKADNRSPASEQVDTEVGAIRLLNAHLEEQTVGRIADDLIHESTHNFLSTYEYLYGPFNPYGTRPSDSVRPVSPWSMRCIQVLPFIHACFVYFAMLHYCEARLRSGLASFDETLELRQRRNQHVSGFLMPGRLSEYVASVAQVDPLALKAIDWMEEVVCDRYGSPVSPARSRQDELCAA